MHWSLNVEIQQISTELLLVDGGRDRACFSHPLVFKLDAYIGRVSVSVNLLPIQRHRSMISEKKEAKKILAAIF